MAGSVNKVILVGNLGRDPEVRSTQDGLKIVNLSLATSESWRDKNSGERRERTEWHRVVIFNEKLGEVAAEFDRVHSIRRAVEVGSVDEVITAAELVKHMTEQGLHFTPAVSGDEQAYAMLRTVLADYDRAVEGARR